MACINDEGVVTNEDKLHRFLLGYTQWITPDQMFSLLLSKFISALSDKRVRSDPTIVERYGFSEECLNPRANRYVSSLASAPSFSLSGGLADDEEINLALRRKIKAFLQGAD